MRSTRFVKWLAITALAVCLALVATVTVVAIRYSEAKHKTDKLDRFCASVKNDLHEAIISLQDPKEQMHTSWEFLEPRAIVSSYFRQIKLCAEGPFDGTRHRRCLLRKDYACLAEIAHDAFKAIPCNDCGLGDPYKPPLATGN